MPIQQVTCNASTVLSHKTTQSSRLLFPFLLVGLRVGLLLVGALDGGERDVGLGVGARVVGFDVGARVGATVGARVGD